MVGWVAAVLIDLLMLAAAPDGDLPTGWKTRSVRGFKLPAATIDSRDGARALALAGAGQAGWFYASVPKVLPAGRLRWSWLVEQAPESASLSDPGRDDSPIRVFVVFGNQGGLFRKPGRVLFYSFGGAGDLGHSAPSHVHNRLHVIAVDGPDHYGQWRDHEVDPVADYRRLHDREPPPITAIGIMQDTDQTGQTAVARLRRLEWVGPA